uniref:craniofacial development protein 1 isoform X2 n=1 Tax=Pristiophorus japonicus TaxID=55135 RepID=UPI00398F8D30
MSDSDSENYSSEEDADYEPSGPSDEDYSDDDVNELVKEDNLEGEDEQAPKGKSLKKTGKRISSRKRNREALRLDCDNEEEGEDDHADDPGDGAKVDKDLKDKKKADDLWASFLSDVGHKSKPVATTPTSSKEDILVDQEKLSKPPDVVKDAGMPKAPGKVTITKVFDFAGEEVKVTKEVDAASKEAKDFLQNRNEDPEKRSPAAPASTETGAPTGSGTSESQTTEVRSFLQLQTVIMFSGLSTPGTCAKRALQLLKHGTTLDFFHHGQSHCFDPKIRILG